MNFEIAKAILRKGKQLVPDRFPQPSQESALAWAEALGSVALPWQVWSEAVTVWASERVGDRMCTPRELKDMAFVVRDRWEHDPAKAQFLAVHRRERLDANYVRMGLEPVPVSPAVGRGVAAEVRALAERKSL